jgi:hypothetical protein
MTIAVRCDRFLTYPQIAQITPIRGQHPARRIGYLPTRGAA